MSDLTSDATNDFFWQGIPTSGMENSVLQRITIDGFEDQQQVQLSQEQASPTSMVVASGENMNNNNRPSTSDSPVTSNAQQSVLPPGVINPDAIIPQTRTYTCRICQVTFPNKSAVTVHSRIHTNHEGKPYRCNFCGKGFSTNFYLKQHERIHNGQKPYKCPMCERSFKQLSHVQQHVRTHTGVRPYKCHWPGCGKAFLQQSHLKSHVARHSPKPSNGIRPYKCHWPECGKSFAQISNLKSHIARHTPKGEKGVRKEMVGEPAGKDEVPDSMEIKAESAEDVEGMADSNYMVSMSPDVIGQAAAAANIVPDSLEGESIRPFLCPGCSKLYVREATFKKHLEECKTKLQMSISATAAALGIEPPPLPPPNAQGFGPDIGGIPIDISLQSPQNTEDINTKKNARKSQKQARVNKMNVAGYDQQQQQQQQIIVEMPLDVSLSRCSPQLSDSSLSDLNVKPEVLNIPIDVGSSSGNVMFKLPPQLLNAVAGNGNDFSVSAAGESSLAMNAQNMNSLYTSSVSTNLHQQQNTTAMIENPVYGNQHLVTSSQITLPLVVSQPLTSSQSVMLSEASINDAEKADGAAKQPSTGHSTINQAALRWQWDQPVPRLNFP